MAFLSDAAIDHLRASIEDAGPAVEWPDPGSRYEVLEEIARGGMGTVYRARDRALDREIALKVVSLPEADAGETERLRREARVIARLEHPGIVPVHDVGRLPDGRLFYAMKLVRGRRLDELAAGASLNERLQAFERICETIAFAHAHGVLHRDLKPENVMVGSFGEVLVMDWGVASVAGGGEAEGTVLGTPGYMAPEQARGEVGRLDARSDVFALGAILTFLLRGASPESGGSPSLRPLRAIADKAMAGEPEARYPGARELAADVARFRAGLSVAAYPEGLGERLSRWTRRHRLPLLLVLAYLVMRTLVALLLK